MGGIVLHKNGSRLEFILDKGENKRVLYDFRDNSFTSYTGRNVKLSTVKSMFGKFGNKINEDESDPMYNKLFNMMKGHWGYSIYNLGTKIERLDEYKYTEKYMSQGFNVNNRVGEDFDIRFKKVSKTIKKLYLKYDADIKRIYAFEDNNKIGVFMEEIDSRYNENFMKNFLEDYKITNWCDTVKVLLNEYKYNPKSLANYLCNLQDFEALDLQESVGFLLDFLRMNTQMGVAKPEKYPRYLHTTHDIVVRNFNAFKIEYPEEVFLNIRREDYEYKGKEYSIIYPKHYRDIQQEGSSLSHCVASYVEKVMEGKTHIVFLRKTDELTKSLVTVEIKNEAIVQYRASYNMIPSKEEMDFLKIYAEKKKLKLN